MTDPLKYVPRPRDLDRASLAELIEGYQGHIGALVNAEHGIGRAESEGRLQSTALDALAINAQITLRMAGDRWVTVRDALRYGATVEKVAVALDMEPAAVVQGLTRWADGQREHELMSAEEHARVLALLPEMPHQVDVRAELEYLAQHVSPDEFRAAALAEVERLQSERDR